MLMLKIGFAFARMRQLRLCCKACMGGQQHTALLKLTYAPNKMLLAVCYCALMSQPKWRFSVLDNYTKLLQFRSFKLR